MISCKHLNLDVHMSKFMLKLVRHLVHTIVNMYSCKCISPWGKIWFNWQLFAIRIIIQVNG